MSGYVEFTRSKDMMPDSFNGTDHMKFSDWEFKVSNCLSAGDYEHAGDILERIAQEREDVADDKFDRIAAQRRLAGQAYEVFKVLLHSVEQSHRWDAASTGGKREAQRRSERTEKGLHMEYAPVTSATARGFMKKSLEIP